MRVLDLSLVIPCYNEGEHLRASAATLLEVLDQTRLDYEVVFVDDASQDDTQAQIEDICVRSDRCRFIFHDQNRGRGAAFKTGFAASTGRVTGFIDIDLEVQALYIPSLVNLIEKHGFDVVTGHRHYLLRQTGGLHRAVLSRAYRILCKALLDFGVKDSETGYKMFRRSTSACVVLGSESEGWSWDTEVMARAALKNLRIHEMPVLYLRRTDKTSTVRVAHDSWRYLTDLHRFRTKLGLSLVNKSPIYWTCAGYDLTMKALYGRQYHTTYAEVARRITDGASVVDLCCGTARLYRDFLHRRGCSYLGLDFNGHFVMGVRKRGVPAEHFDARSEDIPPADYVVMCSSLYHFRRTAPTLLTRMLAVAREAVIISEPVHNLSTRTPRLGRAIAKLTNPGAGDYEERFDLETFRNFAQVHGASEFAYAPGQRNAIAVFRKR
jgi:glycosyltransferase involved in cell wall biosynthesis